MKTNNERGFIALISAILIAGVLTMLLIGANAASFYARADSLEREENAQAQMLSDACANEVLSEIAHSNDPAHATVSTRSRSAQESQRYLRTPHTATLSLRRPQKRTCMTRAHRRLIRARTSLKSLRGLHSELGATCVRPVLQYTHYKG